MHKPIVVDRDRGDVAKEVHDRFRGDDEKVPTAVFDRYLVRGELISSRYQTPPVLTSPN
jgi:hypothetical protein